MGEKSADTITINCLVAIILPELRDVWVGKAKNWP